MIHKIKFIDDWRCFKKGDEINFRPGINLLVGDQGTGKSSILLLIMTYNKFKEVVKVEANEGSEYLAFDFEKDNPRIKDPNKDDPTKFRLNLLSRFNSHGETNREMLKLMNKEKNKLFILDEPDMALSIRSIMELINILKKAEKNKCQIIAAVHNPLLIENFEEVISLEHKKWMSSEEFIKTQMIQHHNIQHQKI